MEWVPVNLWEKRLKECPQWVRALQLANSGMGFRTLAHLCVSSGSLLSHELPPTHPSF